MAFSVPGERSASDMTRIRPALISCSFLVALTARCGAFVVWHTAGSCHNTLHHCLHCPQRQTNPKHVVVRQRRSLPSRFLTSLVSAGAGSKQLSARGGAQRHDSRSRMRPLTTGLGRRRASPAVVALGAASGPGGGGTDGRGGVEGKQELSRQAKLWISVMIDLVGISSYALPGLGEVRYLSCCLPRKIVAHSSCLFAVLRCDCF